MRSLGEWSRKSRFVMLSFFLILWGASVWAEDSGFPTISYKELPQGLQEQYMGNKPYMTPMSHCAAAFDSFTDGDKMAFRCSIYIKMSAQGERRSMSLCEERRAQLKIKAPCKLIVE